jgi:hypothetical protein
MVVVLPAPLGPRNPNISPFFTSKLMRSTARMLPYRFVSPETVIMTSSLISATLENRPMIDNETVRKDSLRVVHLSSYD